MLTEYFKDVSALVIAVVLATLVWVPVRSATYRWSPGADPGRVSVAFQPSPSR